MPYNVMPLSGRGGAARRSTASEVYRRRGPLHRRVIPLVRRRFEVVHFNERPDPILALEC